MDPTRTSYAICRGLGAEENADPGLRLTKRFKMAPAEHSAKAGAPLSEARCTAQPTLNPTKN